MNFGEPWWLWELAGVAVIALILILFALGSRASAARRVKWPRIARVVASGAGVRPVRAGRTVRRPWLLLLATSGVIVALAHPRWGKIDEPVVEQAREVIIALDLSRSMLAQDVPPSRVDRAKLLTKSLLDNLAGERVGIIVFAGTAFVQVPLSADYQIIHDFLPDLKPDFMPQGGTDYEGMLRAALGAFGDDPNADRFLIVLSDGESHNAAWRDHLDGLREHSVRAITLGIGTPAGAFIPDGENSFLKDERGAVVLSKLEPATLQALAAETQGMFRNASDWVDLAALLEATVARGQAGRFATRRNERYLERFQWFLAPAVAFALWGLWREIAVRPRQQAVRRQATAPKVTTGIAAMLVLAFFIQALVPLTSFAAETTSGKTSAEPDARVRETITRLATARNPTARDWRELADRTLVYATGARMNQQPLEAGTVHDALAAVDLGEKADPKLTDWKKLRDDLRATLDLPPQQEPEKKPEEPPPDQQQQEQEPENQKNEQEQSQQNQQQSQQDQHQQPQQNQSPSSDSQSQSSEREQKSASSTPEEAAMGEMKKNPEPPETPPATPPPPAEGSASNPKTRKIGGKPAGEQPPPPDAETAVLLQRLRQLSENDSPAVLFQRLDGAEKQPAERGKDW
jgi:Ca-activated chloride channel homolog